MEILFDGIPLQDVSTSMTINGPAAIVWAFYIAAAEKQGATAGRLRGTLQNDILKEYIAQKEYLFPPAPSMRLVVDTIEHATEHVPHFNPVSICGYHIREAGSTAAQELAFTLADGFAYVERRWRAVSTSTPSRRGCRSSGTPQRLLRGDLQVPGGAPHLGAAHARALRRQGPASRGGCASTPRPPAAR